jgi:hypothetical protein
MIIDIIQEIIDGIGSLGRLIALLPQSPFQSLHNYIGDNPQMEQMNMIMWFIPVQSMMALFQAWLSAIMLYYTVKVPLRWAKVVKG